MENSRRKTARIKGRVRVRIAGGIRSNEAGRLPRPRPAGGSVVTMIIYSHGKTARSGRIAFALRSCVRPVVGPHAETHFLRSQLLDRECGQNIHTDEEVDVENKRYAFVESVKRANKPVMRYGTVNIFCHAIAVLNFVNCLF